ncbi:MAG: hypothetical protein IJ206_02245 [Oscillospiraceae bacterium]|nr:hypothetical protein [Oscillospiraceae bacterium]
MPNLNEKTEFICGRNPLAENNRPSFAKAEQTAAALWLKDGSVDEEKSGAASCSGTVTDSGCVLNYQLESDTPELNAIVVEGGVSVIQNSEIRLSGPGCSDFTCKGAAVLAESGAKVDLRGSEIVTNGATRSATIATTGATLKVFHSKLATYGGPLPEGYVPVIGPGMMEPPAPLGLGGNCRTHLSMDNSESYFYDCDIYAEAWAALSTDSSGGYVYLEANDSTINVGGNGYVVYADNGCHVVLNRCGISSGNVFGIQDGNSSIWFRDVKGACKGYGFLVHGGMTDLKDIGTIRLQNSDLLSAGPMFRCKSTNVDVYLKNCRITCTKGTILETLLTDDEFYYKTRSHTPDDYGVQFTFEEMELFGDLKCEDPERKTCLNFADASITGGITGYPVLSLTDGSSWVATKDSEVMVCDTAGIDAAVGVTIRAKSSNLPAGEIALPSGGKLVLSE